jgi:calcium permeable stress-gated cation channel
MLRWFFLVVTLLTCGILAPINVVYNIRNVDVKKRDFLSSLTIRDVRGDILFAHVAISYIIVIAMCVFIWFNWRAMVRLRLAWFRSPEYQQSFYARTLQIRGVPKNCQSDQGIRQVFESTRVPYPTTNVHIGRKVGKLPELIEYHNDTVREFERVLVRYLKGGRLGRKRPTIRVGGTCGCGGMKKDAIDFYTCVPRFVSELDLLKR